MNLSKVSPTLNLSARKKLHKDARAEPASQCCAFGQGSCLQAWRFSPTFFDLVLVPASTRRRRNILFRSWDQNLIRGSSRILEIQDKSVCKLLQSVTAIDFDTCPSFLRVRLDSVLANYTDSQLFICALNRSSTYLHLQISDAKGSSTRSFSHFTSKYLQGASLSRSTILSCYYWTIGYSTASWIILCLGTLHQNVFCRCKSWYRVVYRDGPEKRTRSVFRTMYGSLTAALHVRALHT